MEPFVYLPADDPLLGVAGIGLGHEAGRWW
ncbi:hypothetical protein SATRM34S_06800 [Streptomyces atroolivaceus]